jgi:undecaprenyl-diphosphatase
VERSSGEPAPHHTDEGKPRLRDTWLIGWTELSWLLATYVVLVGVWSALGWMVVHWTGDTFIGRADVDIAEWFVARRTPALDTVSLAFSLLAETAVKIVVTAIVGLVLLFVIRRWLDSLVIAVSLILEAMVFITVTTIVGRPRPDVPHLDGSPVGSSFPSGHVAAAACYGAMAVVVFWHTRRTWIRALAVVLTIAVPIAVALGRMYRGMHFLTDVTAGALLGATSVIVVVTILRRAEARRLSEKLVAPGPDEQRERAEQTAPQPVVVAQPAQIGGPV